MQDVISNSEFDNDESLDTTETYMKPIKESIVIILVQKML